MNNQEINNKRIAKNSLLLYFRMMFIMLISFYTSRVVLSALGIVDYGIYNVVGGFVVMFNILCGSMSSAISRFITYELGRNSSSKDLSAVFSISVNIQLLIAVVIILVAEVIGIWFLNTKMVIPSQRLFAANWVLQFSILSFALSLVSVPYNAVIVAHEKMSAFAYISIYEGLSKLSIAYLVIYTPHDRLILYGLLIAVVQLSIRIIYGLYCHHHFEECIYQKTFDKILFKKMLGFAGWTFIGSSAIHLRDQGGNILINLFFGPAVNAARGIAMQVNHAVLQFVNNFMMAFNPQITKSYASNDYQYLNQLICFSARFSFYLLLVITLPLIICSDYILKIWLESVPLYTDVFVKLFLILVISDSLSNPIITAQAATGNIKNYQIIVGGTMLLNLPLVYIMFKMGCHPATSIIVAIVISQVCLFLRLYMFNKYVDFSVRVFFVNVYLNVIKVGLIATCIPYVLYLFLPHSLYGFLVVSTSSFFFSLFSICFIGCKKQERQFAYAKIKKIFDKINF